MKSIVLTIVLMTSFASTAQIDLSGYKYVVVPKKLENFKRDNQHRTSTLIKHLFSQKGFSAVYEDNLPEELHANRCLALFVDIINESSMFTTKAILVLKDCKGKDVLISNEGRSKKKDYEQAYNEAITSAFNSFVGLKYSFKSHTGTAVEKPITISFKNDVKEVVSDRTVVKSSSSTVEQVATKEIQKYQDRTPMASNYKKANEKVNKETVETISKIDESRSALKTEVTKKLTGVLYAQELPNGFQLVDSTPEIQLKMYKSAMPNVYVAKANNKDGVVYSSDGKWFFEYYHKGSMEIEELNIKF